MGLRTVGWHRLAGLEIKITAIQIGALKIRIGLRGSMWIDYTIVSARVGSICKSTDPSTKAQRTHVLRPLVQARLQGLMLFATSGPKDHVTEDLQTSTMDPDAGWALGP